MSGSVLRRSGCHGIGAKRSTGSRKRRSPTGPLRTLLWTHFKSSDVPGSKIKECKIFFANLGLLAFFMCSPKRTKVLDEFCQRRLPRVTRFNTRLVCTVHEKRAELVDLFQHILDHVEDFDRETVHCASGHLAQ